MKKYRHYNSLSDLFRYPDTDFESVLNANMDALQEDYPKATEELKIFADYILPLTLEAHQELYTKTFDVQPICYLDLGYVIFKEDYKRGAFLVKMQEEQNKIDNDCGTELPDNISNIFTLMYRSEDPALIDELAVKVLIPGIKIMISEFAQARIALKIKVLKKLHKAVIQEDLNRENVYRNVFQAALMILEKDFAHVQYETVEEQLSKDEYHQSFFNKTSINKRMHPNRSTAETGKLFDNYKLD